MCELSIFKRGNMKKIITLFTVAGLLFFAVSCDNGKKKSQSDEDLIDSDSTAVTDADEVSDEAADNAVDADDDGTDSETPDVDSKPYDPCVPNQ